MPEFSYSFCSVGVVFSPMYFSYVLYMYRKIKFQTLQRIWTEMGVNVLTRFRTLILRENAKTALIQLQDVPITRKKWVPVPAGSCITNAWKKLSAKPKKILVRRNFIISHFKDSFLYLRGLCRVLFHSNSRLKFCMFEVTFSVFHAVPIEK